MQAHAQRKENKVGRQLDRILVVDIEATCWDREDPDYAKIPKHTEIIEIGLIELELRTNSVDLESKRSILVKPTRSEISEYCTQLTTLTQEMVDTGIPFHEACAILTFEHQSQKRLWASWGDYDRKRFEKQCKASMITYPFGPTHLNVKNLFAVMHGLKNEVPVSAALELLGQPFRGTPHRGADDALNIAEILQHILHRYRRPFFYGQTDQRSD